MAINDTLGKLMNQVAFLQTRIDDKSKTIPNHEINNRSNYRRPTTNAYRNNQCIEGPNKVTRNMNRQQTQKISWPQAEINIRNVNNQESTEKCWYQTKFGKNAKFCAQPLYTIIDNIFYRRVLYEISISPQDSRYYDVIIEQTKASGRPSGFRLILTLRNFFFNFSENF